MTTPNDTLKQGLETLKSEETRLVAQQERVTTELNNIRAVIRATERALGIILRPAPRGTPPAAVLGVLNNTPKSNRDIQEALEASGYPYKLGMQRISRILTSLHQQKKIKRIGEGTGAKYVRAK